MKRNKYHARKTECAHGHTHDSKREAARCAELHLLEKGGAIVGLKTHPVFHFHINGREVKMSNGHVAKYTADFTYVENHRQVVEDIKGMIVRDFPLRAALFRATWPEIELRVLK